MTEMENNAKGNTGSMASEERMLELADTLGSIAERIRNDAGVHGTPISTTAADAIEDRIEDLGRHYDRAKRRTQHGHAPGPRPQIAEVEREGHHPGTNDRR